MFADKNEPKVRWQLIREGSGSMRGPNVIKAEFEAVKYFRQRFENHAYENSINGW